MKKKFKNMTIEELKELAKAFCRCEAHSCKLCPCNRVLCNRADAIDQHEAFIDEIGKRLVEAG